MAWIISIALFIVGMINKDVNYIIASGIFAIADAITSIKHIYEDKDHYVKENNYD